MSEEYLTYSQALNTIKELSKKSVTILGIERLVQQNDGALFPDMAGIADFSNATAEESYDASYAYFSDYGNDPKELFIITS